MTGRWSRLARWLAPAISLAIAGAAVVALRRELHVMAAADASLRPGPSLSAALRALYPSPVVSLNRIIAMRYAHGADAAMDELTSTTSLGDLQDSLLYHATLGELHSARGDTAPDPAPRPPTQRAARAASPRAAASAHART